MKNLRTSLAFLLIISGCISCTSDSTTEEPTENANSLYKRVTFQTQSQNPASNTKEVQYYSNNEIIADTVFDSSNQWTERKIIFFNGTTKVFQTLDTSNQITYHREETYDSQGRITGRRTYVSNNNIIAVTFTYNPDNTVTANALNLVDQTVTTIATYQKNSDGLIYKEVRINAGQTIESTLQFNNLRPVSLNNSVNSSVITFNYYTNPKPLDLLKSPDQLNNKVLYGLSLLKMAEEGNSYFMQIGSSTSTTTTTYQTTFNGSDYINYYKSTYLNTSGNNLLTTEMFYYYN